MQKKTNIKQPDRVILLEIGVILALLFVNFGLNVTYQNKSDLMSCPTLEVLDAWEVHSVSPPSEKQQEPKKKVLEKIEEAIIFDPRAIIKQVDKLFQPKKIIMAPTMPAGLKLIAPLVIKSSPDTSNKVIDFPEIQPQFPGGDEALRNYISKNFDIPDIVIDTQEEVNIVVEFVIDKKGQVSDFNVIRNSKPGLGTEYAAKKLYMNMPTWTPGKNEGELAKVRLPQPIKIKIH